MKIYFGQRLLQDNDVLSVTEANQAIRFTELIPDDFVARQPEGIHTVLYYVLTVTMRRSESAGKEERDFCQNLYHLLKIRDTFQPDKFNFIPPGYYRIQAATNTYSFMVRPSGKAQSLFPALTNLHKDLLFTIATEMPIAEICDLDRDQTFTTPYFWRTLAKERLTENPEYLTSPIDLIQNDLHFVDLHPLSSVEIPFFMGTEGTASIEGVSREGVPDLTSNILFYLRFEKLREKYFNRGDFLYYIEMHLAVMASPQLDGFSGDIRDNIESANEDIPLFFPNITTIPADIVAFQPLEERNAWRFRIYDEILNRLSPLQIQACVTYNEHHPKGISRGLMARLYQKLGITGSLEKFQEDLFGA